MKQLHIFSTPIASTVWQGVETLNDRLAATIRSQAGASDSLQRSNVGGWHSDLSFLELEAPEVHAFRQRAREALDEVFAQAASGASSIPPYRLEGWGNLATSGAYHSIHSHPNAAWSGVYYVTGNPDPNYDEHPFSGKLELLDPRPGASLRYEAGTNMYGRFLINPQPGQIVIFPGWLQHQVHPYFGSQERITIAFNAVLS